MTWRVGTLDLPPVSLLSLCGRDKRKGPARIQEKPACCDTLSSAPFGEPARHFLKALAGFRGTQCSFAAQPGWSNVACLAHSPINGVAIFFLPG